jgi:hypothetical protein
MSTINMSNLKNLSRYSLVMLCKINNIKGYSICTINELKKILTNTEIDISSNIVDNFTRYQLKLKCESLGLKYKSKMKKQDLLEYVKKGILKKKEKEYKNVEKEENIFCYPDVLKIIYSYVDFDPAYEERKNLILTSKKLYKKEESNGTEFPKDKWVKYWNEWSDKSKKLYGLTILKLNLKELKQLPKYKLKIWLEHLGYKFKKSMYKYEYKNLVIREYNKIFE